MYEFLRTKEEKLGPVSGTTAALWYLAVLSLRVLLILLVSLAGLPFLASCLEIWRRTARQVRACWPTTAPLVDLDLDA